MSFIDAHDFPAGLVLRVLDIAESTYYDWRARQFAEPPRARRRRAARADHQSARCQRVRRDLRCPAGLARAAPPGHAGRRKRVERIMRTHGLQGAHLRRGWRHGSTRQNPNHTAAPDLVDRDFRAEAPNRLWVADLTRWSPARACCGWPACATRSPTASSAGPPTPARPPTLVLTALNHALRSRDVRAGQLIHHSDKGAQYTALRFTQRLVDAGVAPSTGSTGDSFDNALAENLWSTIKVELMYWPGTTFATRAEAEHALFRYITAGTTRAASRPASAGCPPTSTRRPTIAPSATPTGNEDSGKTGPFRSHPVPSAVACQVAPAHCCAGAPCRTVHASRPGTRLKQPAVGGQASCRRWSGSCGPAPGWRRAQSVWTRRAIVRPLPLSVMARWAIAMRDSPVPGLPLGAGVRWVGPHIAGVAQHSGHRPCWVRRKTSPRTGPVVAVGVCGVGRPSIEPGQGHRVSACPGPARAGRSVSRRTGGGRRRCRGRRTPIGRAWSGGRVRESAGGDPSPGFPGVSAEGPLVQVLPQMVVQALEGLLGRPRPEVVRLASDDRVEGSRSRRPGRRRAGCAVPGRAVAGSSSARSRLGLPEDLGAAADVVAANREGQEIEPGIDASDSRLLLVEGKTPFLQPRLQPGDDQSRPVRGCGIVPRSHPRRSQRSGAQSSAPPR